MNYDELMDEIYFHYTEKDNVSMCGKDSYLALLEVKKNIPDFETYANVEGCVNAGFCENAYNGFCAGFQYAVILLTRAGTLPLINGIDEIESGR